MKLVLFSLPLVIFGGYFLSNLIYKTPKSALSIAQGSFYDLHIESIDGNRIHMADFKSKYVLCVNVASHCGHTPQYKELQALYEGNKDKLVIIGFPCNQFLGQEPGTNEEIASFCEKNYGVTFPLTSKIDVKGKNQHPLYQWLCHQPLQDIHKHEVTWNFHKFLVSPDGKLIGSFQPRTSPIDVSITSLIL